MVRHPKTLSVSAAHCREMTHAGVVYLGLAAYITRGRNPNVPYRDAAEWDAWYLSVWTT
jgi:hypothetical protein